MQIDHNAAWNSCLSRIKPTIGEQGFVTWFKPIRPIKLQDKILTIQVPSQFFYEYLEEHYVSLLRNVIDTELGKEFRLEYSVVVDTGADKSKPVTINLPNSGKAENYQWSGQNI
jgi:chromosomal replication initiator protein